ncbi:hypothetical protein [Tepidibacillus sp. LV47]|uniref:hypothetical protein n=1 Tax=Tepidibacillus sp. LV47 TaxID=3398228 RepID=UPI003AB011AF
MEEKLAIDIFVQFSTRNLSEFKKAIPKIKMILMKDLQLDDRFHPKKYVRYYLTLKILRMSDQLPIHQDFNISHQRIERIHNAALTLDLLEMKLHSLTGLNEDLFCHIEVGGIYVLNGEKEANAEPWYKI